MPEPRRVYLHLGLQKTGTSYLQGVLLGNAAALAAQGLDLVPPSRRESFELMLQVRERYNPERDAPSAADALQRFESRLRAAPGTRALLSQESLAAARPRQVRRLLRACGDREVHVVLTVRDLARQLPSAWQQELKAGKSDEYETFLQGLRAAQEAGATSHPWIQLDPVAVLERWRAHLPPERLHVVTVPPPGNPTTLLLERFAHVLDVDPTSLVPQERASNTSLGRVQAEVLRRVNEGLPRELRRRQVYGDLGKRFFASQVLAPQQGQRIRVPAEMREWCEEVALAQVRALSAGGYRVVGSLDELAPADEAFAPTGQLAAPSGDDVSEAAIRAIVTMLEHRARQRRPSRPAGTRRRLTRALGRVLTGLGRGPSAGPAGRGAGPRT
jgi:hypothetical protein